ncbi:Undecaprenyl-phosphate glucose phosphotransferase [Methylobacterium sp. 4-46]|nr:Undecaprenyl-phosphate glucose phosphotransferase [Methylobacterium sp. 4-46]
MNITRRLILADELPRYKQGEDAEPVSVPGSLGVLSPIIALVDIVFIVTLGTICLSALNGRDLSVASNWSHCAPSSAALAVTYSIFGQTSNLYAAPNLLKLRWQIQQSLATWVASFLFLSLLVYFLRVGTWLTYGELLAVFAFGGVGVVASKLSAVKLCRHVTEQRALSSYRVIISDYSLEAASHPYLQQINKYEYTTPKHFVLLDAQDPDAGLDRARDVLKDVVDFVRAHDVEEILLVIPWNRSELIFEVQGQLQVLPVSVKLAPDMRANQVLSHPAFNFGPIRVIELQRAPLSVTEQCAKNLMDRVLAAAGLFFLAPLMAIVALAIRLESKGPVLFRQTRTGFNGRPFTIFKFRTMTTCDNGAVIVQATRGDRRVTALGRWLRKSSIDELPQLLNVLRGEMSIVGPRPHALAHDNEYNRLIASYAARHKMKPGITGWAQVNGLRGETPELRMMKQRVDSDLWYIESWSIWLDIRIILLTVLRVLKSESAY